ncbi:hypothetical protein IMZ48_07525, partial [Candidatus Bathyarchaeota archaeon]|nr:hypothetical protein [Candidatus Bathyarchaeota archaeon]
MPQQASTPSSATNSTPSSVKSNNSQPEAAKPAPGKSSSRPTLNGRATTVGASELRPEKATVKDRLSRMFSKDGSQATSRNTSGITTPVQSVPRKPSPGDKPAEKQPAPPSAKGTPKLQPPKEPIPTHRYISNPEVQGGHEHFLKNSRRQEKLSVLWRSLIGKKQHDVSENDLSLVSSWMDTYKDRDTAAAQTERKGGPLGIPTLVEKYGKCHEVIGRGAFGIVRISHKKLEGGAGEKLFAVKEFRRRPNETERRYNKRLTSEFCISSSLRHPNVIHTLDLLKDSKG